jgi:sortase A
VSYLYLKKKPSPSFNYRRLIAGSLFGFGLILFGSAVLPIITFQFEYSRKFNQIINPLSIQFYNQSDNVLGDVNTDYTQLSNWFVSDSSTNRLQVNAADTSTSISYNISIPKLKIKDAVVIVGSMDLKKSLIQYPQTALPGQLGSAVIFGHSVLPQFFNPKSYLTIFSTLYKLNQGDELDVSYDNISYRYLIEEMYEVKPTDLSVLEQRFDGRYLTLITCSPPGTYLRRLVVKAKIVDN